MAPLSFYNRSSTPLVDNTTITCACNSNTGLDGGSKVAKKSCMKKQTQKRSRKLVQFAPFSQQYTHIHKNDFTDQERQACFLTRTQILAIVADINGTLRQMRMGTLPNDNTTYFRGLEIELPGPKKEREERRALAMYAIQEYEADHQTHHLGDEWVNNIYRNITARSVELGLKAASFDRVQAE